MKHPDYVSNQEYWDALSYFLETKLIRGEQQPQGFHQLVLEEMPVLRAARTLLENDKRDLQRHKNAIRNVENISELTRDDSKTRLWVSDGFEDSLADLIRTKPVHWGVNRTAEGCEAFHAAAHNYLFRTMPSTPESDCVVWHRPVYKALHDLCVPTLVHSGNPTPHTPQVYFISGILDYFPASQKGFALLPSQETAIDGLDIVSQWARKNGDADVYCIQQSPVGNISRRKDDPDACKACAQAFIHRFLLREIAHYDPENGWARHSSLEHVKENLSRHTFVGYCYGGVWQQAFQEQMRHTMLDIGYSEQETKECLNCLGMVAFGFRRANSGAHTDIPTLTVCNTEDVLVKPHTYDFSGSTDIRMVSGVKHGMQGQTLHVENTFASYNRYVKENGKLVQINDQDLHSMRAYTQLNERILRQGKSMETYRAHVCAPLIRDTIEFMIDGSRNGVRDCGALIHTMRKEHLSQEALQGSFALSAHKMKF
jgi:hypothetical protein